MPVLPFPLLLAAGVLAAPPAVRSPQGLTLEEALARARERAPALLAARAGVDEARARLRGASVWLRDDPVLSVSAARRDAGLTDTTDYELSLSQSFELGGRRGARIAGAEAGVTRELALTEETERLLLRDVATGFLRALHAGDQAKLAQETLGLAQGTLDVARRRREAGDVADLDVNLAQVALARARVEMISAKGEQAALLGDLQVLLGMAADEPMRLLGDLRARLEYRLEDLLARTARRPDLRALQAAIEEAQAERELGEGFTWPDLGVQVGYGRDDGDDMLSAGVFLSLPFFDRGQELRARGAARERRGWIELQSARRAVEVSVRSAYESWTLLEGALDGFEAEALPGLEQNELLARQGYQAGEISLADLLTMRRETLDTRRAYLDLLLETALAAFELEARAGVLQ